MVSSKLLPLILIFSLAHTAINALWWDRDREATHGMKQMVADDWEYGYSIHELTNGNSLQDHLIYKYSMRRQSRVIVVPPPPCPRGQRRDMLGSCRPVLGSGGGHIPLPSAFIFGESSLQLDRYGQPRRRLRLRRLVRGQTDPPTLIGLGQQEIEA